MAAELPTRILSLQMSVHRRRTGHLATSRLRRRDRLVGRCRFVSGPPSPRYSSRFDWTWRYRRAHVGYFIPRQAQLGSRPCSTDSTSLMSLSSLIQWAAKSRWLLPSSSQPTDRSMILIDSPPTADTSFYDNDQNLSHANHRRNAPLISKAMRRSGEVCPRDSHQTSSFRKSS